MIYIFSCGVVGGYMKLICMIFRLFFLSLRCSGLTMSMKIMILILETMMMDNVMAMLMHEKRENDNNCAQVWGFRR